MESEEKKQVTNEQVEEEIRKRSEIKMPRIRIVYSRPHHTISKGPAEIIRFIKDTDVSGVMDAKKEGRNINVTLYYTNDESNPEKHQLDMSIIADINIMIN